MPLSTTHALVPLAAAVAFARKPVPWALLVVAAAAAAAPDLDTIAHRILRLPLTSVYAHRGFTHSLFFAIAVGCLASIFHRRLGARPLTVAVVVGASMASHGILDMMAKPGLPVAYLWPLTSDRLSADWRPIHAPEVQWAHLATELLPRLWSELWQLILPMVVAAVTIRAMRVLIGRGLDNSSSSNGTTEIKTSSLECGSRVDRP